MPAATQRKEDATPRILFIDDDTESCWLMTSMLSGQGYNVEYASNGEEAFLKLFLFAKPDLILLDLEMPVMNGATFRRMQLAYERFAPIPVVIRSAHPQAEAIAKELKVAAVCQKTESFPRLLATIDKILGKNPRWRI